jgi:hypothetical protein
MILKLSQLAGSIILLFTMYLPASAQTPMSRFDFNALHLTAASSGPNGTSVNAAALTNGTGVYFTTGGASSGLDLVVPGALLQLTSIDIHFEYSRNEGTAFLYEHGALLFSYDVQHNSMQTRTRTIGPVALSLGSSGVFDHIQCGYDESTGKGRILINSVEVASHTGSTNRPLAWNSPGDVTIGRLLDGSGGGFVTLGSVAVYSAPISVTPVELTTFTAFPKDDEILLRWTTATELNNYGFEVQREAGNDWLPVTFIPGSGTVFTPQTYTCIDKTRFDRETELRYRLKQIDRDGSSEFSNILVVPLARTLELRLQPVHPNPFQGSTTLELTVDAEVSLRISLCDALGREVREIVPQGLVSRGVHSFQVSGKGLSPGSYFAVVRSSQSVLTTRLLLR